jgi:beta-alanine degradation protein BauB
MAQTIAPAGASLPPPLAQEFDEARTNGCVGTRLLSEDARCRVWTIVLPPGARIGFHTHVLDYFWTAVTGGRARSQYGDGRCAEVDYEPGDIQHLHFGAGESMTHDLANIGDTELIFTTVEFLDSANPPLDLPAATRAEAMRKAA